MTHKLMGRKAGMTQRYDENGNAIACTVIVVDPNVVTQVKTVETDGYAAVQTAAGEVREKRVAKPQLGHFKKAGVSARRHLQEFRVDDTAGFQVGQELGVDLFSAGDKLDVSGTTKGRGYQGTIRLHGFRGGPAAHGSGFHRHSGSTGMRSTPGRCLPGGKRASQMGNRQRTTQNVQVVAVDKERNLLLVKGSIPGATGSWVTLGRAVKGK